MLRFLDGKSDLTITTFKRSRLFREVAIETFNRSFKGLAYTGVVKSDAKNARGLGRDRAVVFFFVFFTLPHSSPDLARLIFATAPLSESLYRLQKNALGLVCFQPKSLKIMQRTP